MNKLFFSIFIICFLSACTLKKNDDSSTSYKVADTVFYKVEVPNTKIPNHVFDLEVYFFDVSALKSIIPKYQGKPTYTAEAYVVNYQEKSLKGPFSASTFPNSVEHDHTKTIYNTVLGGSYIFNNRSGHKGATQQGLNLVLETDLPAWTGRKNIGFNIDGDTILMGLTNVHAGASNNGNYNSRGSHGCITLFPNQSMSFFKEFGMESRTTGNLDGGLYVFRTNDNTVKDQILKYLNSEIQ